MHIQKNSHNPRKMIMYDRRNVSSLAQFQSLDEVQQNAILAVSAVLPFRVNNYLIDELIDWDKLTDDPIFQLVFPQPGMLAPEDLALMTSLVSSNVAEAELTAAARVIQTKLNPHPAGQMELNVPTFKGRKLSGVQHKYRETVLFFPSAGQTCFSFCTYCFRWPQFVGIDDLKFASAEVGELVEYLKCHKEVRSVLITGGDPMIMRAQLLSRYIEPLLIPELEHINSIRIGTKSLAFWPQRYVSDDDCEQVLRLFEKVSKAGKHLAIMAHYSHPRFLDTAIGQRALQRVINTGAVVRCQSPLINHVNNDVQTWSQMWNKEVRLGAIPYYMFVERDTGARQYFEVPLVEALSVFQQAYGSVSGLARTVRGPSMSCTPGKIVVEGITTVKAEKLFVLKFLQARDPSWLEHVFFAKYDPKATWIDQLRPGLGQKSFPFEAALDAIKQSGHAQIWAADRVA